MRQIQGRMWASVGAIGVATLVALLSFAGVVQGPPPEDNPGQPFQQIMDAIEALEARIDDYSSLLENMSSDLEDIASAIEDLGDDLSDVASEVANIEAKLDHLEVVTAVDKTYCATGGVQCAYSGHTFEEASPSNHNPIRISVLVTLHGSPVLGLGDPNLDFSNPFVPAGASGAVECDSTDCGSAYFQYNSYLYVFFVHPASGNWDAGHYHGRVTVTAPGGEEGTALIDWEIE